MPLSGGQFSNRVHYIGVVFQLDQADAGLNERCFSRQGLGKAWVRGLSTIRQVQGGPGRGGRWKLGPCSAIVLIVAG